MQFLAPMGQIFKVRLWDLNNTFGDSENVFTRSLSSMSERLLYKYNNKVELVNTHMTKRKEWLWCNGNNIPMYKINITINENKEPNLPSGIVWGNQTNKDLYSQSSKTTYYTISWNIEITR